MDRGMQPYRLMMDIAGENMDKKISSIQKVPGIIYRYIYFISVIIIFIILGRILVEKRRNKNCNFDVGTHD
jgi:hypothetical protein